MDLDGIQNFLIFTLAGVIGLVVLWRIFKTYLSSNDSGGIESQGKAQLNNMANAGIAIGGLAVAAVFIGWVATLIMEAV
ncbi:hypothetical protein [Rhodococcus pyridinivorans]|uniref:hypothetical protein n=1 Tax=Rhodococcus pyridinivorans TaxID=103816 RepID=UPI002659C60F|nr:hypothetical protein [Rhodococcus pyridinivorans]